MKREKNDNKYLFGIFFFTKTANGKQIKYFNFRFLLPPPPSISISYANKTGNKNLLSFIYTV